LLYKPSGISSFKFINQHRRENAIAKIGHTGTLDPLAKGLLLVATDDDTKLIQFVKANDKEYIAEAKLGILTNTLDIDSEILKEKDVNVTKELLEKTIKSFIGIQLQTPPQVSAKKVNGKRAYALNREGKSVELTPVEINIKSIELLSFKKDVFVIKTLVSKGTYIRQLINDIGLKLDTYATMTKLERTQISGLSLEDLNKEIDLSSILEINVSIVNNITQQELADLLNGKQYKDSFATETLLVHKNIPISIIKERQPIKVFPKNIKTFYNV
jgi:tRNA pseudouridine55 synthase